MDTSEIVAALADLIERWTLARDLLASTLEVNPGFAPRRRNARTIETLIERIESQHDSAATEESTQQTEMSPPAFERVTVKVLKPHVPRQRRVLVKVAAAAQQALKGSYPAGPVVVSPRDAARVRRPDTASPLASGQKNSAIPANLFDELIREAAQRSSLDLAS